LYELEEVEQKFLQQAYWYRDNDMMRTKAHVVIRTAQLFDSKGSYSGVDSTGPEKFKCIIDVNFSPHGKQFLHRLLYFKRVSPCDGLEEFGKTTFIAG